MKVLVLGSGPRSDWLATVMGDYGYEVERVTVEEMEIRAQGKTPDLVVFDEMSEDYAELELRYLGHRGSSKTLMNCDLMRAYMPEPIDKRKELANRRTTGKGPRTRWGKVK